MKNKAYLKIGIPRSEFRIYLIMQKIEESAHQVQVNLDRRPVCLGVGPPSGAHDQIFVFCLMIAGFLMKGALSDERVVGL
jgi:hypothetical protein